MAADYVAQLLAFSRRAGACDAAEILRRRAAHARSITEDKIASVRLALESFVSSSHLCLPPSSPLPFALSVSVR
jgi:hypothetical protein